MAHKNYSIPYQFTLNHFLNLIFRTKTKNLISINFEVQIVFLDLQPNYITR